MKTSHTATEQKTTNAKTGGNLYVTTDGILRFCIIAPLLELPHDFKEWYKPSNPDVANAYPRFAY